jgi:glycosyltransferase involved in cell wall biosynthesis
MKRLIGDRDQVIRVPDAGRADKTERILFVDHAEGLGGAEYSLLLLMRYLDHARFQPMLACNDGVLAAAARRTKARVEIVPMPRLRRSWRALGDLLAGALGLARLIRQHEVDIVHSNVMRASFYALLAARLTRRPLVWHVRDIHEETWYMRLMCAMSAAVIAISRAVARRLPCGATSRVIYNGVELEAYALRSDATATVLRQRLELPQDALLIASVGRLRPWKGHVAFLRAARLVAGGIARAHFVVVGGAVFAEDEGHRAELEALAGELGLDGRVTFTDHVDDLPVVLAGLDIMVHAAEREPFGRVIVEAMACGLPVVAFDDGAASEIVLDGTTGVLVKAGDTQAMASALLDLAHDAERRERLGRAGRRRAELLFDVRARTQEVEAVYAMLAGMR